MKEIDEQDIANITVEIAMFLSWYRETNSSEFPGHLISIIIETVFERENYNFTKVHVDAVQLTLVPPPPEDQVKRFRLNTNFNGNDFLASIDASDLSK